MTEIYIFLGIEAALILACIIEIVHDRRCYKFIITEKNHQISELNQEIRHLRYLKMPACCKGPITVGYSSDPEWQRQHFGKVEQKSKADS